METFRAEYSTGLIKRIGASDLKSKELTGETRVSRKNWSAVGYVTSLETDNEENGTRKS